jgi:endonuclease/exonuclease/phosphatase family metal-dependent hydrolase
MNSNHELSVLTWNIYLGGDHVPLIGTTIESLPARMSALWGKVLGTWFPARARLMAELIAIEKPDVIGLQEVMQWSVDPRPQLNAAQPYLVFDFVTTLLGELASLGVWYTIASHSPGIDLRMPTSEGFEVHYQDSLVVLMKIPRPNESVQWSNGRAERFRACMTAVIGGQQFTISRQWNSLDLQLGDQSLRLINAHLEYHGDPIVEAQCKELLQGPADVSNRPVILFGDFNADAETSNLWKQLTDSSAGNFKDAFKEVGTGDGGTWQENETLNVQRSANARRLDWILYRGNVTPLEARAIGFRSDQRTAQGLLASDHAAVFARFKLD